jgi:hypothetical protein
MARPARRSGNLCEVTQNGGKTVDRKENARDCDHPDGGRSAHIAPACRVGRSTPVLGAASTMTTASQPTGRTLPRSHHDATTSPDWWPRGPVEASTSPDRWPPADK